MIFFCRDYGDDMKKNFFKNQTLLLVFSILIGFATIILGVGYAFYVFDINISDLNSLNTVKAMKVDLDINPISGSLKLCQSYPITVSEGLNCEPYIFSVTNNNNANLVMYLNLETDIANTLTPSNVHIAFAECEDSSCANNDYRDNILSGTIINNDVTHEGTTGFLLSAESSFEKNTTKYYKIILWQDENSTLENKVFNASIGAVSYTKANSNLTYNVYYAFNDSLKFDANQCDSTKEYEVDGNYCKKTYSVLSTIDEVPNDAISGFTSEWIGNPNDKKIVVGKSKYNLYANDYYYYNLYSNFDFSCYLSLNKSNINVNHNDSKLLKYYGWESTFNGENNDESIPIKTGNYTYYIKNYMDETDSCSISIEPANSKVVDASYHTPGYKKSGGGWYCPSGCSGGYDCYCPATKTVYYCDDTNYKVYNNSWCYK